MKFFGSFGAAKKAAFSDGKISEKVEDAHVGMQEWQSQLVDSRLGDVDDGPLMKTIQGMGLFPIEKPTKLGFITSVCDSTSGVSEPVISVMKGFQEPHTPIFQHSGDVGVVHPNYGFVWWANIGVVFPELIQPPFSGTREMVAHIRMLDITNVPSITDALNQEGVSILWEAKHSFNYDFAAKGYQEAVEHGDEARALTAKVALGVALADDSFDRSEGETMKNWVLRTIEPYPEEKKADLKKIFTVAVKEAYADDKAGNLDLDALTKRLNEIGEKRIKYETIELCFDLMIVDHIADVAEMKIIRTVADGLGLNLDEIEKIRGTKLIGQDKAVLDHGPLNKS